MTIYTVHAPPLRTDQTDPERFKFVRDGFYFWAFVFGPLWLLFKRLWVVLIFYIIAIAALQVGLWFIGVPSAARGAVTLLLNLLLGLEAATLQRWTLDENEWSQLGVVTGNNYEAAERRFFDNWVAQKSTPQSPAAPSQSMPQTMRAPPDTSDIIGLFPEPQSRQ
jgi:hypothetical protein